MTDEQNRFVVSIASALRRIAPVYGIRVISPIVGQAIIESAWGKSELGVRHNYFGLKCRSNWTGRSYSKETKEEYVPGQIVTIVDSFRVYDTLDEGITGYFEFLFDPIVGGRYDNLRGITDPRGYLETIKADGYATSSTYVSTVMGAVNTYDLRRFDWSAMDEIIEVTGDYPDNATAEINLEINADLVDTRGEGDEQA